MTRRLRLTIFSLMLTLVVVAPETGSTQSHDHDIVVDDYFTLADIMEVAVSPDGGTVAYTERRWAPPAEKRTVDLWVVDAATRQTERLTFSDGTESGLSWSSDGQWIYFSADETRGDEEQPPYDGSRQVWRIRPRGGEPQAVTRVADGIDRFMLTGDGSSIHYAVDSSHTDDEWKDLRERFSELEYGHGVTKFSEVHKLDLATWRHQPVVAQRRVIHDFDVSTDGALAMVTTADEELIHLEGWSRVEVYDPANDSTIVVTPEGWRSDHPSPFGWIDQVAWAGNGSVLGFTVSFDGYPTLIYTAHRQADAFDLVELDRPEGVHVNGGSLAWRGRTNDLCFTGDHRAAGRVYLAEAVSETGAKKARVLTPGAVTVDAFDCATGSDDLVIVTSTLTSPPDIYSVQADGKLDRLTEVNPQVNDWKLPQIEIVRWTSTDGTEVEGILELPPGYAASDGPLPLVVELHGGPTADTKYRFRFWIYGRTLMAANGYALLSPNYRGSTGYGDKFLVDLVGRENDIDVKDIMTGVDAMIERGIADPDRLAVMGWSNGGFLTNCLITTNNRFKAASSGAGVIDQVIQWGIEDTPGHVINFMEGRLPWADPDEYRAGSPLYRLDTVTTPTLIHVGGNDPRVPVAHSKTLYRALKQYLEIPTELVIYPDEGHGLTTYQHRRAKMEWDLAWFRRYLMDEGPGQE